MVAASELFCGSATPIILEFPTSTDPVPLGLIKISPLESVELIVLPLKLRLSTVSSVMPATDVVVDPRVKVEDPKVIVEFAS